MLDVFSNKWQTIYQELLANPQFAGLLRRFASILDDAKEALNVTSIVKQLWKTQEVQDLVQWLATKAPELAPLLVRLGEICLAEDPPPAPSSVPIRRSNANVSFSDDANSSSSAATEGPHVHQGVQCDGCGQAPIVGKRFKKKGHDFDLCDNGCFDKVPGAEKGLYKEVNPKHPRYGLNHRGRNRCDRWAQSTKAVHTHVSCDGCGMSPILGTRYHKDGHDYDLCSTDFALLSDAEKAKYVTFTKPQLIHPNVSCDGCGQAPLIGRRYKMVGRNFDLCENDWDKLAPLEKKKYVVVDSMVASPLEHFAPRMGRGCEGRKHRHMARTATCPASQTSSAAAAKPVQQTKDDTFVLPCNRVLKHGAPKTEKDYEEAMQKAIAESLALSERAIAENMRKVEAQRAVEAKQQADMTESLVADLAAVAAIEATEVKVEVPKAVEAEQQVDMTESLVADLAAVAAVESTETEMTESLVADLAAVKATVAAGTTSANAGSKDPGGNLSRYVANFVPGHTTPKPTIAAGIPTSFTQAASLVHKLNSDSAVEMVNVSKNAEEEDALLEAALKMSTISTGAAAPAETMAVLPPLAKASPKARFVCDVSCPDKSTVLARSHMQKTWRFRNDGATVWPAGTSMVHVSGDFVGSSQVLTNLPLPGGEVDVTMTLDAPSLAGRYVGYFRLTTPQSSGSVRFGHRVWVDVMVVQPVERSDSMGSSDSENSTDSFTLVEVPVDAAAAAQQKVDDAAAADLSNESFDALSQRFEALAHESLTILNEPLNAVVTASSEGNGGTTPPAELEDLYEDDFENDEDSPRNRSRSVSRSVVDTDGQSGTSMMSASLVTDLVAVAAVEETVVEETAAVAPVAPAQVHSTSTVVVVEDMPLEAGELPSDENTDENIDADDSSGALEIFKEVPLRHYFILRSPHIPSLLPVRSFITFPNSQSALTLIHPFRKPRCFVPWGFTIWRLSALP
jgi:hypothetical protein